MEESKSNSLDPALEFLKDKHINYLLSLDKSKDIDSIGYYLTEHLRVAGCYWTINSLFCLNIQIDKEKITEIIKWILQCQNKDGGFGGNCGHDSHITSTHYAVLVLILFDSLNQIDTEKVATYIANLQQNDGSFCGDSWSEIDTRFSYCALSCLTLLQKLDKINVGKACEYVLKCKNFDGSFGGQPDAESHGAYVFTGVGALKLANKLDSFNKDELGYWLSERQTNKGGFNGRPEKLADVCYSWWIYSACKMIKREKWVDQKALENFILSCQDTSTGGFSDRPGNVVDVFHTFFGIAALSLLDEQGTKYHLEPIDPTFALPKKVLNERFPFVKNIIQE